MYGMLLESVQHFVQVNTKIQTEKKNYLLLCKLKEKQFVRENKTKQKFMNSLLALFDLKHQKLHYGLILIQKIKNFKLFDTEKVLIEFQ